MKVQVTRIEFDLHPLDIAQQPNYQEKLQEEYIGQIFDVDLSHYGTGGWDDEDVITELMDEITYASGETISFLDYRYILS